MSVALRILLFAGAILPSLAAETLEIDAKLLKATPVPSPADVRPYPRALCTYLYEVEAVHAGRYDSDRILVVKWAVWNRQQVEGLPSKPGTTERLALDRWVDHPEFRRERIVDAIKEHDLVLYYDTGSVPKVPSPLLAGREKELETGVVRGAGDGWLFLADELHHAATGEFWKQNWKEISRAGVDPLPAMLDFQKRLAALDVQLLIVPVPSKVGIYPEHLQEKTPVEPLRGFVERLTFAGLNVLDLEPVFQKHRKNSPTRPLYLAQDSHWSPEGCRLAAKAISAHLNVSAEHAPDWIEVVPNQTVEIRGDLARMAKHLNLPREKVLLDRIDYGSATPGERHLSSRIVLVGDSHVAVFSDGNEDLHGRGAGLPDYLALESGHPVDVIASYGDGVNQARVNLYQNRSLNPKDPDYWKNKQWVIWCFSAREFTRAKGWSTKIPVAPSATKR